MANESILRLARRLRRKPGRVGLALGGGAARGWAHIGVIEALADRGIRIDCIAGTSMGALVGAFHASGRLSELREIACGLDWRRVLHYFLEMTFPRSGMIDGRKIADFARKSIAFSRIEDMPIPFKALAADVQTGEEASCQTRLLGEHSISNLLLCCSACGRLKGARFPLDPAGEPLFIDPSHDDPWAHLNFVPETGALMPREWRDADLTLQCSEKGRWTAQILLGDERIQDGWRRTWRHLARRVREFLALPCAAEPLLQDLQEEDTRGLLPWCFGPVGRTYSPFLELREHHPAVWQTCETRLAPAP